MAYDKIRRRLDVVLVKTASCHPQLVRHDDGGAALVELRIEGIGCRFPVEQAIAGHRTLLRSLPTDVYSDPDRGVYPAVGWRSRSLIKLARRSARCWGWCIRFLPRLRQQASSCDYWWGATRLLRFNSSLEPCSITGKTITISREDGVA